MNSPELKVALVLPDNRVADVLTVPAHVLRRMARQRQCQNAHAGLDGPVDARLALAPRRGVPALAGALRWEILANGHSARHTLPTSVLQPLVVEPAAAVRQATGLPADATISYVVLMPDEPQPVWQERLEAFATLAIAGRPNSQPLFPDLAMPDDVTMIVGQDILDQAVAYCLDPAVEKGGVLLGYLCRPAGGGSLWAEIFSFAPAVGAMSDATHLSFTAAAWENIERQRVADQQALRLTHPLQILGWVHGHPRVAEIGPFFLSHHDTSIMSHHFAEPFAVAVVVDARASPNTPLDQVLAVFGWDEQGVGLVARSLDVRGGASEPRR